MCGDNLRRFQADPLDFIDRLVIVDETWVDHATLNNKEQSKECKHLDSRAPNKATITTVAGKIAAIAFWDAWGFLFLCGLS